ERHDVGRAADLLDDLVVASDGGVQAGDLALDGLLARRVALSLDDALGVGAARHHRLVGLGAAEPADRLVRHGALELLLEVAVELEDAIDAGQLRLEEVPLAHQLVAPRALGRQGGHAVEHRGVRGREDQRPHPAPVDQVEQVDREERDQPEQDAGEGDEADDLVAPDERGLREHPEATGGDDVELGHEIGSGATLPQCPARSAHGLTAERPRARATPNASTWPRRSTCKSTRVPGAPRRRWATSSGLIPATSTPSMATTRSPLRSPLRAAGLFDTTRKICTTPSRATR